MGAMSEFGSPALVLFVMLFLVVLGILWFLLPFAVFGVKDRLDQLIRLQRKTNELMQKQLDASTVKSDNDFDRNTDDLRKNIDRVLMDN
jgi:biopolymer transport protein ExbB/TolQ